MSKVKFYLKKSFIFLKHLSTFLFFLALCSYTLLQPNSFFVKPAYAYIEPVNPNASDDAKKVLNWINELPNRQPDPVTNKVNRVISGQFLSKAKYRFNLKYDEYVVALHEETNMWVSMIGFNYGGSALEELLAANSLVIDYWNDEGLITVYYTPDNPWTGEDRREWGDEADLVELIDDSCSDGRADPIGQETCVYDTWIAELDKVADAFDELQSDNRDVIVLFTPFDEMTYRNLSWWCTGAHPNNPEPFKNLWKQVFRYLSFDRGLNNLLWVYAPANIDGRASPFVAGEKVDIMDQYPGDDYVDIIGISMYREYPFIEGQGYSKILSTGKPLSFTGRGCDDNLNTINGIINHYPKITYFVNWSTCGGVQGSCAIINSNNATHLLNDPWVITREEVNWQSYVLPAESIGIIIDNDDIDPAENKWFTTNTTQRGNTWETYTSTTGEHYNGSHRFNWRLGDGDTATWHFFLDNPGTYKVYAWWWDYDYRPTDVPYTINHADGSNVVQVNQQENGGQWNLLGTYRFESGQEYTVVVSDQATPGTTPDDIAYQDIVADAIKLEYFRQCFGDNSTIDSDDVEAWSQDYFAIDSSLDINSDSKINSFEFAHILSNWGEDCGN